MAEAFERARYESLMKKSWTELRPTERATRIEVVAAAFDAAGISAMIASLTERAAAADRHGTEIARRDAVIAQRDAEIARLRAEHEAEIAAVRAQARAAVTAAERRLILALERERLAFAAELADLQQTMCPTPEHPEPAGAA